MTGMRWLRSLWNKKYNEICTMGKEIYSRCKPFVAITHTCLTRYNRISLVTVLDLFTFGLPDVLANIWRTSHCSPTPISNIYWIRRLRSSEFRSLIHRTRKTYFWKHVCLSSLKILIKFILTEAPNS